MASNQDLNKKKIKEHVKNKIKEIKNRKKGPVGTKTPSRGQTTVPSATSSSSSSLKKQKILLSSIKMLEARVANLPNCILIVFTLHHI